MPRHAKYSNSRVVYDKTKDLFWAKISMNTSFQLLLYNMEVKSQEDQQFASLNFSDVMRKPPIICLSLRIFSPLTNHDILLHLVQ